MEWYRKRTLGGVLEEAARRWPGREAFSFNGERWTFAQFIELSGGRGGP